MENTTYEPKDNSTFDWMELDRWTFPETIHAMIVEDDETTSRLLKAIAVRTNAMARIRSFATAEESIEYLEYIRSNNLTPPDVAIVDISLKGELDGYAVLRELEKYYPETTVAVTTSVEPEQFFEKTKMLWSSPIYLPKPFTVEQIAKLFEKFC